MSGNRLNGWRPRWRSLLLDFSSRERPRAPLPRTSWTRLACPLSRAMNSPAKPVGEHLREWRTRRRMSQMDLALEAEISTRHLSFLETGRAQPSREMVLHLSDQLEVPLRERNVHPGGRGLRAGVPRAQPGRPRPGRGPPRRGRDPEGARALPGPGRRPALEPGGRQRRRCAAAGGRRSRAAGGPDQRHAPVPAPQGPGAAHRQPRRVARARAGAPAPAGRAHRRPGPDRPDRGDPGLSRSRRRPTAGRRTTATWPSPSS